MTSISGRKMNTSVRKHHTDARPALRENLKALRCLYDVARITAESKSTTDERLTGIAKILPEAFSNPDAVYCRITLNDKVFESGRRKETKDNLSSDIVVRGAKVGTIEIGRTGAPAKSNSRLSAKREVLLLNAVAERIGCIEEHRMAEDILRESEEKFSKAFHSSPAIISITNLEDGRIIDVNESFERYSGYKREEAINLTTIETGRWIRAEERGQFLKALEENGKIRDMEITSRTKKGDLRTGLISADLITLAGKPCVISVTQDITEQKHSNEFVESLSNASQLAIYVMQDEKIKYCNLQFQGITGYSREELLGFNITSIIATDDIDVFRASTMHTLQGGNPYPCEYRLINKEGQTKWVMQTVSPVHFEGKQALMGNVMDITERKYLERKMIEYEELNKMKGDIVAAVSHELRTPLAAIKGYATMILDYFTKISPAETRDYVKSIDNSADKLIKLVDDLLDTSRMDSGLLELEKFPTSITGLIKSLLKETAARLANHRIITELPADIPRISIDIMRIKQVLDNLINNAVKYSPKGTEILISVKKNARDIEVTVTDHGRGIPANELINIFDRMHNAEQKVHLTTDGMGLSLHICQRILQAHGGKIWAESEPGKGSSIHFTLPLEK